MSDAQISQEELLRSATRRKDGDQLYKQDEDFKALMGDDEDTVTFVFQHVTPEEDGVLARVARTTRGILSFGAIVQGEVEQREHQVQSVEKTPSNKPFRHWKPSIIVEKKEIIVNETDQAMLQVQINGYPKPDIRCTFGDMAITPNKKYKIYHENEEHILMLVIKNVHFEDSGTYTVTAENEVGFDSVDIHLTVVRQKYPEIKCRIDDLSVSVNQVLIIPVEIDGIPKPEVVFLKDGKHIQQDNRIKIVEKHPLYTLILANTMLVDTGIYSVIVTNVLAQVSQTWSIYVYTKPKFLQKLGPSLQISQGDTTTLKVKIQAVPKASVSWYKDHQQIVSSQRLFIDYDNDLHTVKINDANIRDAGVYRFRAENIHGSIEDSLRIDVKKAPQLIKIFGDVTVLEQDVYHIIHVVVFGIELEAFPQPTVEWYLDGEELMENVEEFTRVETSEAVKLIINEPTTDLSGEYLCRMYNECGSVEVSANLTVNCSPRLMVNLNDVTIDEGLKLELEIVVRSYPPPSIKWHRNNTEFEPDERMEISVESYGKHRYKITFAIAEIRYAERGDYAVEVRNDYGLVCSRCNINVLSKPVILEADMQDLCIKEGSDITYTVRSFSNPPATAVWMWEGELIDGQDRNKLITSNEGMEFRLGIRKAKVIDSGIYQCLVSNCVGMVRRRAALVVMRRKRDESV